MAIPAVASAVSSSAGEAAASGAGGSSMPSISAEVGGWVQAASGLASLFGRKGPDQNFLNRNRIGLTVADAKRSGIHPLYALGAAPTNWAPAQIDGSGSRFSSALSDMGQGIERAGLAGMSRQQQARQNASQTIADSLALEHAGLQNELLRTQIANSRSALVRQPATPPGYPSAYQHYRNRNGTNSVFPSPDLADLVSENPVAAAAWFLNNGQTPTEEQMINALALRRRNQYIQERVNAGYDAVRPRAGDSLYRSGLF